VLHGAGQSDEEFGGYWNYLPSATRPMFYSRYYNLPNLNAHGAGARFFDNYRKNLDRLGDASHTVLLHIAIHLGNGEGHADLDGINSGRYDLAIDELVRGLPRTGRPVFLRLGYEFNGEWNAYDPAKYKQAWKRIAKRLDQDKDTRRQVALVWDMSCKAKNKDWEPYYPGDEYVDWWGVNVLDFGDRPSAPDSACVRAFVDAAGSRAFPVMIAESMPEGIGTRAPDAWAKWFSPYFNELLKHPAVKAFSYINRDCTKRNCVGGHWGTARIQDSPHLGPLYAHALASREFVHAGHLQKTCEVLKVDCLPQEVTLFM